MEYEAEQSVDPTRQKNYFSEHGTGQVYGTAWQVITGMNQAGWMVGSPVPDSICNYGQTSYTATFTMKVTGSVPPTRSVARCEVWVSGSRVNFLDLRGLDFSIGDPKDFRVSFTVPSGMAPGTVPSPGVLYGGVREYLAATGRASASSVPKLDLRVYWYGSVTTYLDKVIVTDRPADTLWAGTKDAAIKRSAKDSCARYPAHERFYLLDEPLVSAFKAFGYVGSRIRDTLGSSNEKAGTLTATYHSFSRYLDETQACQLMMDPYFIWSAIPHPSVTDPGLADSYGFARWDSATY